MGTKFINEFKVIYKKMGEVNATSLELNSLSRFFKNYMSDAILDMLVILLPIMAAAVLVAFVGDLVQVKWKPTAEPMKPKADKFNPVNGIKRIFQLKRLFSCLSPLPLWQYVC